MNENNWITKWSKDQIKAMLLEQVETFWHCDTGTQRTKLVEIEQSAELPHAVIVSGLRRVGKSTLLAQFAHRLGKDKFYYLNFEDDRFLGFQAEDANDLFQLLVEFFGERKVFVIDEIQNIPGWEHFVRRFMEMGYKFYITGSNAALLSRKLGSRLTGRYVPVELFPFSFNEYIQFRGYETIKVVGLTTTKRARLNQILAEYILCGGIPEPLKYPNLPLLRFLYDDVLYRDIAARYQIQDIRALRELAFLLMSNPTGLVSFNKLKETLHLGSVNTIKNYIEYLENSWLVFSINVYDYSVKRQQIAPKKIFGIDTGLINAIGFSFSANTGKLLENLVFLALRRKAKDIYYFSSPGNYQVDFFLPESRELIQVSKNIENPGTREREIRGLTEVLRTLKLTKGLILSNANAQAIEINGMIIEIRSIAEWLIDQ